MFIDQINVQLFIFQTRLENWWHHDEHPEAVLVCDGEATHYKVCRKKSLKSHNICFQFKNNGKNSIPLLSKITNITITSEELQILVYARHSWPLSSGDSLACHTYCDTRHPFLMVISEDCDTHIYCRAFRSGTVTTCFYDLGLLRLGFKHPTFCLRGERSNPLRHRHRVKINKEKNSSYNNSFISITVCGM